MEERRHIIEPRIQNNNKILFVGINPVEGSFKNGYYHYFSNNNYFYTLLKEAGFTKDKENDLGLRTYNYGIVNYCDYITKTPSEIPKEKLNNSKEYFINLIKTYKPLNIIFLGKFVPQLLFNLKSIKFGEIQQSLFESSCFVVPFPTNFMSRKQKVNLYKEVYNKLK